MNTTTLTPLTPVPMRNEKGQFNKGCNRGSPWNKGIPMTEEQKREISERLRGHLPWNKGIRGAINSGSFKKNHIVTEETRIKLSHAAKRNNAGFQNGHEVNEETRRKLKAYWTNENRKRLSELKRGKHYPKISLALRGRLVPQEQRRKQAEKLMGRFVGEANPFYGKHHTDDVKRKLKEIGKQLWATHEHVRKIMKARQVKPNKAELKLLRILNNLAMTQYRYTGDGSITIAGKIPDFVCTNHVKRIIELFGQYWHSPEEEPERIAYFKQFGWDCLVVWEAELRRENLAALREKLLNFAGSG